MKTKFLMVILAVMTAVFSFSSCSKEKKDNKFNYSLDTLCGTWEGIAVKTDNEWIDITSPIYEQFNFSITFYSNGTYYGKGYFGNGSGTYKAFGNTIETYVGGEVYFTYHVNSMTGSEAELTMSRKGSSIEIRVRKK